MLWWVPDVYELVESRKVVRTDAGTQVTRVFKDLTDAYPNPELALLRAPAHGSVHPDMPGLYVSEVRAEPVGSAWTKVFVTYSEVWDPSMNAAGEIWTWDIESGQQHITSVRDNSYAWHYPDTATVGTAIGVDGDQVHGVDVYRPAEAFNCRKLWDYITVEGMQTLRDMRRHFNLGPWQGYADRAVLFLGAKVGRAPNGQVIADYSFVADEWQGETDILLIDDDSVTIDPPPHDYLWFRHGEKVDGGERVHGIRDVHLAQVYDAADFEVLGLAGPWIDKATEHDPWRHRFRP